MLALEQTQAAVMRALDHGPEHMPEGMFAGAHARALLGMKVHANTVSHARLVALEDTFPRTRALIGHERFNEHSRRFTGLPGVTARPLALIGRDFPHFLALSGEGGVVADLAVFEWAWLSTYHAAEAPVLTLADLTGSDEAGLLDVVLARHPAANMGRICPEVCELLADEVPGLVNSCALLLTRPDAEVVANPATRAMWEIFSCLEMSDSIGNLFTVWGEPECKDQLSPDDFMPALIALLEAGALQQVG